MSLLLNLREWVGLGEAMTMAAREGLFALSQNIESNESARWQLLLAYAEDKRPMRLSFGEDVFLACQYSQSFISVRDTEHHPLLEIFFNIFDISPSVSPHPAACVCILHPYQKQDGEPITSQVYSYTDCDFYGGYSALTWEDVIETKKNGNNHLLQLRTDSLLELFAKAKGVAPVQAEQPKKLSGKSETSYQNIIGAMLKLLEQDTKNYPARTNVIDSIREIGESRTGLSERHLFEVLAKCARTFNSH